ncbi:hypothetical protein [Neisseria polysaccharea]|uniref:hypothetical protein n=1 Tax=Neisseria polysaccharea TaxID=489 RepID=UPI0034E545E5
MLYIPPTTPDRYVSSIVALNIISPDGTGDWHSAGSLHDNAFPEDIYIYGEGQKKNTNDLLGRDGIIDGTARLNRMGYFPENAPVWLADHPRACVDLLYTTVLQDGILGTVMLDEWFPAPEDKQAVYRLLDKMEPHLSSSEKENLTLWKKKNPLLQS